MILNKKALIAEYKLTYLGLLKAIDKVFIGEEKKEATDRITKSYLETKEKVFPDKKIKTGTVKENIIKEEIVDDTKRQLDDFDMLFR